MRMVFFFGNVFWGLVLILLGMSIFLKGFNINLPLMKVFFAIVIIMFGIKMLIGSKPRSKSSSYIHNKGTTYQYSKHRKEYTMVFSGGTIDLSDLPSDAKDIEVTVVFGTATVILPSDIRFEIEATTVFGATVLPGQGYMGFGDDQRILNPDSGDKAINIESTSVFGRLEYVIKDRAVPRTNTSNTADSINMNTEF